MTDYPADIMQTSLHAAFPDDDNEPLVIAIASALLAERTHSAEIARREAAHCGAGFGEWLYQRIMEGRNG